MDQIFNELSVSACYPEKYAAQAGMDLAIDVSRALANLGMSKIIRTTRDFTIRRLANEYTVAEWARDKNGSIEGRRYFLTYATKSPYIEQLAEEREQDDELFEYRFGQDLALGLGLAYMWGISSISLAGDSRFIEEILTLREYRVTNGKESLKEIPILTFSRLDKVESHKDIIQQSLLGSINNGLDLIENASAMLPFLSFCPTAIDRVKDFQGSERFFPEVLRHLFILNATMREYCGGAFTPNLDFSTESESTMSNTTYARMRSFLCNDGIERQFKLHSKIKSANKRIYFYPYPAQKIVHIGYVGDHLPTTKFQT